MATPAVSVIIPVYNTEQSLPRCLDSVLAQTFGDIEVILVDDGSPDRAGAICDAYAARDGRVRVVHQDNAGLAEARRAGLKRASADWVVHVDSDDTLPPDAVATLHGRVAASGLDMAWGGYRRIAGGRQRMVGHAVTGTMDADAFLHHLLAPECICASWGAISRRELWSDDVFPPPETRLPGEDVFINVMLTSRLRRVELFNTVTYEYRLNPHSLSIAGPLHRQELWKTYFELLRERLSARGVLARHERQLQVMEINRLAFCTADLDPAGGWCRQVLERPAAGLPARACVLRALLRHPRLLARCIAANRVLKRMAGR